VTPPDTLAAAPDREVVELAATGALESLDAATRASLLNRGGGTDPAVERAVASILADVRERGDDALREFARRFDRVELESLEVPREAWDEALASLDPAVRDALEEAAASIAAFHRAQLPPPLEVEVRPGLRLGRRADPLERVGVYAPGGRAAYPSSVLMGVVPARAAGVSEVIVCSPPGPDGRPPAAVLAACALAGADRVFALGGAGAVAAMAYGTAAVPAVDKIVGPGNAYVTEAKRQLSGVVASDCPAGPSEVLVVADETADPELAAAEILAQAEHDPDAASVLVSTSADIAAKVVEALSLLLPKQARQDIIRRALAARGAVLTAASLDAAIGFANAYAPEHLVLMVAEPREALARVRAAGTVFLGNSSSVAFGDYVTGANHVLPTAGLARAWSGLSTFDFVRWTTYQEVGEDAAAVLSPLTVTLADAEGLPAHALAARLRGRGPNPRSEPAAGVSGTAARVAAVPLRATYRDVPLYDPGRRPVDVDLSDNTNLFGVGPAAARALAGLPPSAVTRYPAVFADRLKAALAELHGVAPENVTTGCGSDDVIDSAVRAFCEPGDVLAYPDPTFGMVPLFGRMNGVRPVAVPLGPGYALDADALLAARGRVTYICTPNNPTGTAFDDAAIERVAVGTTGVLLLDEAYAEFAGHDFTRRAAGSERILSLRTLSKAYGLAGLRIGYAVGPARLIAEVEKSRGPYKISGAAEAAAVAVLTEDRDWVANVVATIIENRARLAAALADLGFETLPSAANFLLVRLPAGARALAWNEALRTHGVAARPFSSVPGSGECLRVSVGPWEMMERFLAALAAVAAEPPRTTA